MTSRIDEWARLEPTKTAVIFGDDTVSYGDFARAIEASRKFFERQELPVGRTAIVLSANLFETWVLIFALRAVGLNTISIFSAAHAADLKIKDAACVVVSQSEESQHYLKGAAFAETRLITVPSAALAGNGADDLPFDHQAARRYGGHIIYSSGTTGTYKKIMMDAAVEDKRNEARARAYSYGRQTIYHALDFGAWTTVGFKNPSAVWHVGGCVVLDQSPDAFKKFFEHPVTFSLLIPSQLKDLVQWTDKSRLPSDEFELGITAGFLPLELAEQTVRQLTRNVFVSYGSSELGIPLMVSHFKARGDLHWLAPVSGQLIQIVDDDGNECATGQEGELRVRPTEIDCTSYVDDEEATSQVFRDGFFYPGDMAIRRPDGRIRILGRTGDVLNVQGTKIAAAPLEFAIQRELRVDEVCLFSRLDGEGNEELAVVIQSDQELSRSQLDAVVRMLPPFPRVRFAMRPEFPRTETGTKKTQRTILRKLIFAEEKRSD